MNSNYTSLYYFTVTVEEMNFTKAAEKLFISQQALSKHIHKLESQYNTVLFYRSPHLRLTQAGEYMYRFAKSVVDQEKGLVKFLSHRNVTTDVKMPIGIASLKGHILLPYILQEFKSTYANVVPTIHEGNSVYMDRLLQSGQVDLYFTMRQVEHGFGKYISLQEDSLYFVVSEELLGKYCGMRAGSYIAKFSDGINAEEISRFPITYPNPDTSLRHKLNSFFEEAGVIPNIYTETNNYFTMYRLMEAGQCGSLVSKLFIYDMLVNFGTRDLPVVPFKVKGLPRMADLNIVIDSRNAEDPFYQDFIECAKHASDYVISQTDAFLKKRFSIT